MKKILLSVGSIFFVVALLAGGTGAFLADSNSSTGNTFATGVIDLKIDNESYFTDDWGKLVFSSSTSWSLSNLAGKLFFNFLDLKPGDIGEDTISLHVNSNNAYACMNVLMTGTPENGQNEPEALVDPTAGDNDGELQNYLNFVWWADDGDNVYEQGEKIFKQGLAKDIFDGKNWSLADSANNIWGDNGPIPGGTTKYIGKAWCFGTMAQTPLSQDGKGKTGDNGPLVRGTGFTCSGVDVGNIVQSDGIKANVSFSVAQSRNNGGFLCQGGDGGHPPTSTSTLFSNDFNSCSKDESYDKDSNDKWSHYGKGKDQGEYQCGYNNWHGGKKDDDKEGTDLQCRVGELTAGHKEHGDDHKEAIVTPSVSTVGYHSITLQYDRKTDDIDAPPKPVGNQTLTVEYSVNGGGSWINLETVTGESPWTTKTFSLSPAADNKPNVKIRFTLVGDNATNRAFIDNISITGVSP
jgi:hypothetical protein